MTEPSKPLQAPGRRLDYLDSLRGLAAIYVVLFHLIFVGEVPVPSWLKGFAVEGASGVMLFFVISCFSLFYTMPARLKDRRPTLSFYMHRFFRIAPLFYLWLIISCFRNPLLHGIHNPPGEILNNFLMIFNLVPGQQSGIAMASWTIGVEVLFYAIFPLIFLWVRNLRHALIFLVVSFFASVAIIVWAIDYLPLAPQDVGTYKFWLFTKDIPVFAFGAVCYFVIFSQGFAKVQHRKTVGTACFAACFAIFFARSYGLVTDAFFFDNPYMWHGLAYSFLLVGLALFPVTMVVNTVTGFLGKIAYSVYLSHGTVILLSKPVYRWIELHIHNPTAFYLTCLGVSLLMIIPLSYLTYRYVEEPFIRFGKKSSGRIFGAVPARA
ncbi:acyltransferase family protein [Achromobacter piechaudii]|uniref:acyltransferase family protein n=1 Tax=Achromobacter piechaudii TaxID=72556 RepID=UPI00146612B4|nr:acyltransferase [Achromobacter piechaudii]CAB3952658.1 hypothetical protein LMG6103_03515 [Achromobacter piechaudii]